MKSLIAIAYPSLEQAETMRAKLVDLQHEYLLELEDIAIAEKQAHDKVKLHQAVDLTTTGAVQGSFLGLLVGVLFLNPLLGVVVGAASGAITGALADIGIDDPMMKQMGETLQEGSAILFVLIKEMNFERFVKEVEGSGGLLIKTSLKHADSAILQRALESHGAPQLNSPTMQALPPLPLLEKIQTPEETL